MYFNVDSMKILKRIAGSVLILLLCFPNIQGTSISEEEFYSLFRLVPRPQKIEFKKGRGLETSKLWGIYMANPDEIPELTGIFSSFRLAAKSETGVITLNLNKGINLPSPEGYFMEVSDNQVVISATERVGLFYGLQTLAQLLQDACETGRKIPSCYITDYPAIGFRAVHLDLKHHLDAGYYYYELIDRLAALKVNAVIIEFEDKLRYRKVPLVGAPHAISIEEFAALSRYARGRFIEISPLVQGLGHASYILKHDEFRSLRDNPESDWAFDPLHPGTYQLQFALYEDAIAATPYGRYLHVGGDEVGDLGKSENAQQSGMTPFQLQMYWLNKVCKFAEEHNRIPVFWDDMVFKLSGLYRTTYDSEMPQQVVDDLWAQKASFLDTNILAFPRNCVFMRWNYDNPKLPGNMNALGWYRSHGLLVMAATSAQQIWPMLPRNRSNFSAIKDFCQLTAQNNLTGILCTIWDDCSPHFETVWRGIYDFAYFSWNAREETIEKVHAAFRQRFYGALMADKSCEIQDLLEDVLPFWETALLEKGDRENYHKDYLLIDLPDPKANVAWSLKYREKINAARNAIVAYSAIRERLTNAFSLSTRNHYNLKILNQINELQVFPARLILLLEEFDHADQKGKSLAKAKIENYINSFPLLRKQVEDVFAVTRILGNPESYQLDSNFHEHLANGTNNTDWMYLYELPMIEKIRGWISRY